MISSNFELGLVESIQPIRHFVLASSIHHLFSSGIYDFLSSKKSSISSISDKLSLDKARTYGFLMYLVNENILIKDGDLFELSEKGVGLAQFRAWYTMLIGGYGATFLEIGDKLKQGSGIAGREIVSVGVGSCGISHYDAFPLTKQLIQKMDISPETICDMGCGNGMYLVEFCNYFAGIKTIGIEPNEESCVVAREYISSKNMSDRVEIVCADAAEWVQKPSKHKPDMFILGFVLHEIMGQRGRSEVVKFLTTIRENCPDSHIVVIEVDDQIATPSVMQHALAKAYYNPYYLLHYFTNQKLLTPSEWESIFRDSGYAVKAKDTTSHNVDSTGLELGYLLAPAR
jgi:2-ketoarginine methyltransferase